MAVLLLLVAGDGRAAPAAAEKGLVELVEHLAGAARDGAKAAEPQVRAGLDALGAAMESGATGARSRIKDIQKALAEWCKGHGCLEYVSRAGAPR